uniref:Ubiquitin-conjugating enzyme E2 2-like n=1 Tax=Rhizophora mucronata TaxID=61149 RepID=A0A2P2LFF6_RHIMU
MSREEAERVLVIQLTIGVEHARDKPHSWGLIRIIFHKMKSQLERTSIPRGIIRPKYNSIPKHNIIILRSTTNACRGVLLQPLKIPHQSLSCRSRHCHQHCLPVIYTRYKPRQPSLLFNRLSKRLRTDRARAR